MKVISISQPGLPEVLKVQQRPVPILSAGQVLIRVKAAGVNRPDVFQRKGVYPPPAGVPQDIPGLEVSGVIEHCGKNVTQWKEGDPVCALLGGGGYAELVIADAGHCLPVPKGWSFTEAASLPETVFTVWHNVFQRGQLKEGERFLVHGGSSGIGITAIQLATIFGAEVYCTAGSLEKCRVCQDLGAKRAINYKEKDFEDELKDSGVDVILDMIGGNYTAKNLRLLKADGRLVFINAMTGKHMEVNIADIMSRRLTITGSTLRPRDRDFKATLALEIQEKVWPVLESRRFTPVIYETFKLEDAARAHELMESNAHIGKIVLTLD